MTFSGVLHDIAYRAGSGVVLGLLRLPVVSPVLGRFAKIWLRHARIASHLRATRYDQIIDGGANIGEFAALVRAACPEVPLLCIEPHPLAATTLRARGFEVVEAALWSCAGTAVLRQPSAASTSATIVGGAPDEAPHWAVSTLRIDQLPLRGHRILLKLDLQGAEAAALEGVGAQWNRLAGVLLEVSYGAGGTLEELRSLLASRGFVEAATFNELEDERSRVVEADKLWLRSGLHG